MINMVFESIPNYDQYVFVAVGLFIVGLLSVMVYERSNYHHQINKKNNRRHQHHKQTDNSIYFTSLKSEDLEKVVINQFNKFGFPTLTNIQNLGLKVIVRDYDSLLVAPTGSGKTEAAILPIIKLIS